MKMFYPCSATRLSAIVMVAGLLFSGLLSRSPLCAEGPPAKDVSAKSDASGSALFETKILPVLTEHCYQCHSKGSETIEGGLELDSPSGMLRGGDSGPMLKAHQADQSQLLGMLRHDDDASPMPPDERLSDEVIAAFEDWIRVGAPDSRQASGPTAKEERLTKAKQHWAFQPAQATTVPQVALASWPRDPLIDRFVLARIESEAMEPVADANRTTLVRRLYFDLIGLPPSPEQIDALVADRSPGAINKLVDQLLDSPQFGERWGRHWLDVVRYAESSGMEFNFTYPHAWPYRNYVIESFNADKPFDQFLREQIAGDLLPSDANDSPTAVEAKRIAPSVLAFGPKRHNSSGTEFQMDIADDQIDVVFKSTMAVTVSCARCHDHKFDPIPTKDYYALAGIFLSTEPLFGTIKQKYSNNPTDLVPIGENAQPMHEAAQAYDKAIAEREKALADKRVVLTEATESEKLASKERTNAEGMLAAITSRQTATNEGGSSTDAALADTSEQDAAKTELDQAVTAAQNAVSRVATLKAEVAQLESDIATEKKSNPPRPAYAMSVRDRAKPADTKLAIRGDFRDRGEVVPRGFLTALNVPGTEAIDSAHSGRLELARWIASPDNPLTARVMVNRIWHHLLGRGIVPTVDNFGVIGKSPTHPHLLDALALQFVENQWSVKQMIRTIVLSRTYQLSSQVNEANMAIDPDNRLLWRASPRRLEAETIRDAVLVVSGQLDHQPLGGSTVTALGDKLVRGIPTDQIQPASNRRSVYLPVVRDYIPELFDLFDFPSPSLVSGQRAVTNVPSQALYLRNSAFIATQSRFAAERLLASTVASDDKARVSLAMRWALARTPTDGEVAAAVQLIRDISHPDDGHASPSEPTQSSPATDEAVSHDDPQPSGTVNQSKDTLDAKIVDAWTAWFLTLFSTAEFRYLVDIDS